MTLGEELLELAVGCCVAVGVIAKAELQEKIIRERGGLIEFGDMLASVTGDEVSFHPNGASVRIAIPVPYASFQDTGTGVYAGNGPIHYSHPVAFWWRRQDMQMSGVTHIRGTPATYFWRDTMIALETVLIEEAWNALG